MATLDGGRIGIASQALGIAQGAYESAKNYALDRIQFGKPVAFQQGLSFKIADMATQIRAARMLVYSAAELKENHENYGMEAAMAKQFASDTAVKVTEEAIQCYGGNGYLKGMDVERMYRDAKITQIYEGTNEIMRVVISGHILGKPPKQEKKASPLANPQKAITGIRKKMIFKNGSAQEMVDSLVENLKADGHDFTVGIDIDTPITKAARVVSAGKGIGPKENMKLIEELARQAGAAIGSSRPVAETLQYVPMDRYVGMSGQKFNGNLYIACGISGAVQHLKGITNAGTIVAINTNPNAPIFKNCDYGIVGDVNEILPLLAQKLNTGKKKPAGEMKKIRRPIEKKEKPSYDVMVCDGCGYEYDPMIGDPANGIAPGTLFENLPDDWVCPHCSEPKAHFEKS